MFDRSHSLQIIIPYYSFTSTFQSMPRRRGAMAKCLGVHDMGTGRIGAACLGSDVYHIGAISSRKTLSCSHFSSSACLFDPAIKPSTQCFSKHV